MHCSFIPYEGNEKFIFVSYSHKDFDIICPILDELHKEGYRIWYDEGIEYASDWSECLAEKISSCEILVTFQSKNSLNSPVCVKEIKYADDLNKTIFSIYLEDLKLTKGLDLRLSGYQYVNLYQINIETFYSRFNNTKIFNICKASSFTDKIIDKNDSATTEEINELDCIDGVVVSHSDQDIITKLYRKFQKNKLPFLAEKIHMIEDIKVTGKTPAEILGLPKKLLDVLNTKWGVDVIKKKKAREALLIIYKGNPALFETKLTCGQCRYLNEKALYRTAKYDSLYITDLNRLESLADLKFNNDIEYRKKKRIYDLKDLFLDKMNWYVPNNEEMIS